MAKLDPNIEAATKRLKQAEEELLKAVYKKIEKSSASEDEKTKAEEAAQKAAAAVYEAQTALAAAADNLADAEGVKGGRRKHKARGTKRRRRGGFMEYLPDSLKNLFGLSPNLPPGAAAPVAAAPVAAAPPRAPASFGGKSGKKRKHSRRKY